MNKCFIVGASKTSTRKFDYDDNDLIIAADGGYNFLKDQNIRIDYLIGDLDSIKNYKNDTYLIKLNPIKDFTDTHEAIELGIKNGYHEFHLYGCLNGRIEHVIASLQDAYNYAKKGYNMFLYDESHIIRFLNNNKIDLEGKGFISIFSFDKANGVTLTNLKYELKNKELLNTYPLGVSNEFLENKKATIEVKDGCLVIIYSY